MTSNLIGNSDYTNKVITTPLPTHDELMKIMKSRSNQRDVILSIVKRCGYISSEFIQRELRYMSPSARMAELRKLGYQFQNVPDKKKNGAVTYVYLGKEEGLS